MRWRVSALAALLIAAAPAPEVGKASWYGEELRGSPTANGERFDPEALTAAHPRLAFGTWLDVTSLDTGRTVRVRVNDRGPYHAARIIDLSARAARRIGLTGQGSRLVRVARAGSAPDDLDRLRARHDWRSPPARALPAGPGAVWLQVATFSSHHRAKIMARALGARVDTAGGMHRVRLGPYATARTLNAALASLARRGYPDPQFVRAAE